LDELRQGVPHGPKDFIYFQPQQLKKTGQLDFLKKNMEINLSGKAVTKQIPMLSFSTVAADYPNNGMSANIWVLRLAWHFLPFMSQKYLATWADAITKRGISDPLFAVVQLQNILNMMRTTCCEFSINPNSLMITPMANVAHMIEHADPALVTQKHRDAAALFIDIGARVAIQDFVHLCLYVFSAVLVFTAYVL